MKAKLVVKLKFKSTYQVRGKVVAGFILAFILLLGISGVTFFSIRNLLDTVAELSQPNEKQHQLNGLMADVIVMEINKIERTSDKDTASDLATIRANERLMYLKAISKDALEYADYVQIGLNISELRVVFAGLEEVRNHLTYRTFSAEALKEIEIRIKRQQELHEMETFAKFGEKDLFSSLIPKSEKSILEKKPKTQPLMGNGYDLDKKIEDFVKDIQSSQNRVDSLKINNSDTQQDSLVIAIRSGVEKIFIEERSLQHKFQKLESSLLEKNTEIFSQIQHLIYDLQLELSKQSNNQNRSAYKLARTVAWILGILVFLGVVGSLGFIFSILKEVNNANMYRKKLEEAKKNSDKLAKTKQDFLANMSHEIRNPLHAIQGYHHVLACSNLDLEQKEYVDNIGFASENLLGIVNDILDFSKLEAGHYETVHAFFDPISFFNSFKSIYAIKAKAKELAFELEVHGFSEKWLICDKLKISQILNNLLGNSLKFTHEGSIKSKINFTHEGELEIKVSDTGIGMNPEVLDNIFKEFHQGDASIHRRFGGTGLGMTIVKKLVENLSGKIEVYSQVDQGTTVKVIIPCKLIDPILPTYPESAEYSLEGVSVLIVEDDPLGFQLIKMILQNSGANVVGFQGGISFSEQFVPTNIDVALIDIQMPGLSGFDVAQMLKQTKGYDHLPILAMTANVFLQKEHHLIDKGFDGVILKPFHQKEILNLIGDLLNLEKILKNSPKIVQKQINLSNEHYDLSDIMLFCVGDEELFREIIQKMVGTTIQDLESMEIAMLEEDFDQLEEIVHQLSSRLKQIKAKVGEVGSYIEHNIRRDMKHEILPMIRNFVIESRSIIFMIQRDFTLEPV